MWWLIYVNLIKAIRPRVEHIETLVRRRSTWLYSSFICYHFKLVYFDRVIICLAFKKRSGPVQGVQDMEPLLTVRSTVIPRLYLEWFWLLPWGWELSEADRLSRKPGIFTAYLRLEYLHTEKSWLNTQGKPEFLELDPSAVQVGYFQHEDDIENSSTAKLFSPQGALKRALQHILTLTAVSTVYLDKQISLSVVFWGHQIRQK